MKTIYLPTATTLAAALGASLALAACQPAQQDATTTAPGQLSEQPTAMSDRVAGAVGDAAVTVAVNAELAKDAQLSVLRIDVDTQDGRVTLAGSAPSEAARDRATLVAQSVRGVTSVDNRLAVEPAPTS